jgi:hypothetical protein
MERTRTLYLKRIRNREIEESIKLAMARIYEDRLATIKLKQKVVRVPLAVNQQGASAAACA